jgi:enoyl-CoA hydratase
MLDALHDSEHRTLEELLAAERRGVHLTMGSDDAREGISWLSSKNASLYSTRVHERGDWVCLI